MLEEEQAQAAMEAALAVLHHLQNQLQHALDREHVGRQLFSMSAQSGDAVDRLAALQEVASGQRSATGLRSRIEQAEQEVVDLREKFLAKRIERKQAETLLRAAEAREVTVLERRMQQSTDDWYLGRMQQREDVDNETLMEPQSGIRGTT